MQKFNSTHLYNRELVLKMLNHEDKLIHDDKTLAMYDDPFYESQDGLFIIKTIQRITLSDFGFINDDDDLEIYRNIFRTYYRSPTDYDSEIINAVTYFRENKTIFYQAPEINIGENIKYLLNQINLLDLNENLHNLLTLVSTNPKKYTYVGGFSAS